MSAPENKAAVTDTKAAADTKATDKTKTSESRTSCKVMECVCTHEYQDSKYGRNRRVFNPGKPPAGGGKPNYKCTVCGRTK